MFSGFFGGGSEKRKIEGGGRENLGGDTQAIPSSPDYSSGEFSDQTIEQIEHLIRMEELKPEPDADKLAYLEGRLDLLKEKTGSK